MAYIVAAGEKVMKLRNAKEKWHGVAMRRRTYCARRRAMPEMAYQEGIVPIYNAIRSHADRSNSIIAIEPRAHLDIYVRNGT